MKKLSICVCDWVEFTYIAAELTKYFERVFYCSNPSKSGFTEIGAAKLGSGIEGVEKIQDIQDFEDDIDIVMFPDIEFSSTAERLKREGRFVWGSGKAEELELDRDLFLKKLASIGLPVPETEIVQGMKALQKGLKGKEDLWIKINKYRGIKETFYYSKEDLMDEVILEIKVKVGCFDEDEDLVFLLQKPIKTAIEYGRDRFSVNGMFPENFFLGFEDKGIGYISKFVNRNEMWDEANEIDDKFSKILQEYKYTGFCSDEVRVDDKGLHYLIDPCMRCGYPSSPSYFHAVTNWGDIISEGVKGNLVEPKSRYKYCAEIIVRTEYEYYNKLTFENVPDGVFMPTTYAIRNKIVNRIPGKQLYADSGKAGICVGGGKTLQQAIENCTKVYESVKGQSLDRENTLEIFSKEVIDGIKKSCNYNY